MEGGRERDPHSSWSHGKVLIIIRASEGNFVTNPRNLISFPDFNRRLSIF